MSDWVKTCFCGRTVEWTIIDGDFCGVRTLEKPYPREELRDAYNCTECMIEWWQRASVPNQFRPEPSHLCKNIVPYDERLQKTLI